MALLILFGFVAGAATALSPCVLPVLPIALSAGATGGRRRPLGIVAGLAVSFTFATVALVYVISALGLPDNFLRTLAIAVLIGFGVSLMIPPLAARIEAYMSRFAGRAGVRTGGDGFWSGTAVGASLGLVYAPCAGPILAGVITVSASQPFTAGRLAVALSYGIGSAVVLYFLMLGGRRVMAPLARRGAGLQIAMGAVMVVVALAMLNDYDIRFQNRIASDLPSFLVNPSEAIEDTSSTRDALADVRGARGGGFEATAEAAAPSPHGGGGGNGGDAGGGSGKPSGLPVLGTAPQFVDTQEWFNTPGGEPRPLSSLRGRVVLVDFWTYSCINCIRTLPYLTAWDKRYRKDGLTIVGVHSPEFPFEKDAGNVGEAIERNGIEYPVVQDNNLSTFTAYGTEYWPAEYFVDANGKVRYFHFGEGEYEEKERVIRRLLAEAGRKVGGPEAGAEGIEASAGVSTPESYLGSLRADRFVNGPIASGAQNFGRPPAPPRDHLAYSGRWKVGPDSATAEGGALELNFGARRVYLVLGSPGRSRSVRVLLDGRPIPARLAGEDVENGTVEVDGQRLYDLVDLPRVEQRRLRLVPEAGVEGYAFTFG
ncbi:MAG TPA: cytochrome c biogenesis protein DipZ [Solirubrobacterales bacterium]|nr:cytochrome c biogenesis protein DipZ [Solirubrobacterales bacterium]